jgi:hypothetical protein
MWERSRNRATSSATRIVTANGKGRDSSQFAPLLLLNTFKVEVTFALWVTLQASSFFQALGLSAANSRYSIHRPALLKPAEPVERGNRILREQRPSGD